MSSPFDYDEPIGPSISWWRRAGRGTAELAKDPRRVVRNALIAARTDWRATSSLKVGLLGGLSAISPIEDPMVAAAERLRNETGVTKAIGRAGEYLPSGAKSLAGGVARAAGKWIGPLITAYRLGYDNDYNSVGGFLDRSSRIIGEEISYAAGAAVGMKIGSMAGAAVGSALGPGVGTVVGFGVGMVAGGVIGAGLAYGVGKAIDLAEMPLRAAALGYRYIRDMGKDKSLELGGRVSRGNASRGAYTMRQRALQQINRSGMNTRSLLGQEAMFAHIR